jgi:hypothetical protein
MTFIYDLLTSIIETPRSQCSYIYEIFHLQINSLLAMSFEPETALIKCSTSKGEVTMEMYREWSPNGFDRVVSLYEQGFYDQSHFYRVIPGYMVQFGIR